MLFLYYFNLCCQICRWSCQLDPHGQHFVFILRVTRVS